MAKILVVEDDPTYQKTLQNFLIKNGHEVFQANNGQTGLSVALNQHPDLILLDIRMPVMGGLEMLASLRKDETYGKNAKVILLTNFDTDDEILANVNETSPAYYLIKSNTSLDGLLEKVEEVLSSSPASQ